METNLKKIFTKEIDGIEWGLYKFNHNRLACRVYHHCPGFTNVYGLEQGHNDAFLTVWVSDFYKPCYYCEAISPDEIIALWQLYIWGHAEQ